MIQKRPAHAPLTQSHTPWFEAFCVVLGFAFAQANATGDVQPSLIFETDIGFFMANPRVPWTNDPFVRAPGFVNDPGADEPYALGGILFDDEDPIAIINGRRVYVGDEVNGREVVDIGENWVILKRGGSEIELTLPPARRPEDDLAEDAPEPPVGPESRVPAGEESP